MRARIRFIEKRTGNEEILQDEVRLDRALQLMRMAEEADNVTVGHTPLKEVTTELHFPRSRDRLVVVNVFGTEV